MHGQGKSGPVFSGLRLPGVIAMNFNSGIEAATQSARPTPRADVENASLLLVDEDKSFTQRLARAFEARGFVVRIADSVADGLSQLEAEPPSYAVVDIRLRDGNGLDIITRLRAVNPAGPRHCRDRPWQHRNRGRRSEARRA